MSRRAVSGLALVALAAVAGGAARRDRCAPPPPVVEADRSGAAPAPLRALVDTTIPPPGRVRAVPPGGDLQAALDAAAPGDVITLEPGATYRGPFRLPKKPGSDWITIRTAAPDTDLPAGVRVDPRAARFMPRLQSASGAVVEAEPGAHHYRFIGVEMRPRQGTFLLNLLLLGAQESAADQVPHHIIVDRCYLHGDPRLGTRRGIALNSRDTAVIDSWLADFKEVGADSQAIGSWNGPGPFKIVNNYLEAAGENILFGGATPSIQGLVASDIEVRRNHFFKPLSWKPDDPAYEKTPWSVKNIFELKNARRVLVADNLLENNWAGGQNGFGILFTVRTELDAAPWAVIEDVAFTGNVVRNTASAINILGIDDSSRSGSGRTRSLRIAGNLFVDVGARGLGGSGTFVQILNGAEGVTVEHNTVLHTGPFLSADMMPTTGLAFQNNIVEHNEYGAFGSGKGSGLPALEYYFPGFVFRRNVIVGTPYPDRYPPDNAHPRTMAEVGFADAAAGDYRLAASSPFRRWASDGGDAGADVEALMRTAASVASPTTRRGGGND